MQLDGITAANMAFVLLELKKQRPSAFVILLNFSNLPVIKLSYGQASDGDTDFPTFAKPGRLISK
jgi:hypothetical protein